MTWFHQTPNRSSRRDQHRRRTPSPQHDIYDEEEEDDDDYTSVVLSDRSPNDTELDQPANDDNDNDDDRFSDVSERNNVRKETVASSSCSASNSNSPRLSQPSIPQPANSYMNIASFPTFRGCSDECPFAHLSRFAKVCRANNVSSVDMMERIFPVTLEDEAAFWYDLNVEPYGLTWEETKSSFSHAYGRIEVPDQLRSQLMAINQGDGESVRSYFLRLQWILKKWAEHGLSDDLLKGVFVDGLMGDFQEWMAPQRPGSLKEALRLAFCFEQVRNVRDVRRNAAMNKCGFCEGLHEERGCEVRERMRKLWLQSKNEGKGMVLVGLERNLSGKSVGVKELGRSVSNSIGKNIELQDGKEEGELGLKKRSQCRCEKHQCWKKNLERNNSTFSGNFKGEL